MKTATKMATVSSMHGMLDDIRTNILENWDRIEVRLERAKALMQQI